jgi:hypothetical protein
MTSEMIELEKIVLNIIETIMTVTKRIVMSFLTKKRVIGVGIVSATITIIAIAMIWKMTGPESAAGMKTIIPIVIGTDPIGLQIRVGELFQKHNNFVPQPAVLMIMPLAWKAKVFHRVDSLIFD